MLRAPPAAGGAAAGASAASPGHAPAASSSLQPPASPAHTPHGPAMVAAAAEAAAPLASGPTVTCPLPAGLDLAHMHIVLSGGTSGVGLEAAKASLGSAVFAVSLRAAGAAAAWGTGGGGAAGGACPLNFLLPGGPTVPAQRFAAEHASKRLVTTLTANCNAGAVRQECARLPAWGRSGQGAAVSDHELAGELMSRLEGW